MLRGSNADAKMGARKRKVSMEDEETMLSEEQQ